MSFEAWLQGRLVAHGYKVAVDGVIGHGTTNALVAFQKAKKLKQSGVADAATIGALRMEPGKPRAQAVPVPVETMPPWMAELHRRMGLHEVRNKSSLIEFLRIGKFLGDPAKLPWCGDATESAIVKTLPNEVVPNNPFWAQGWKDFGIDAKGPKVGSVGVIRWNASSGHVGFVANYDKARNRVLLLGGNQSNAITLSWFGYGNFIAFRWPRTFPFKDYPAMDASGASVGTLAGTR